MFITGVVENQKLQLLIDTGSTITILSNTAYNRMKELIELSGTNVKLLQADGTPVEVTGKASITMRIGTSLHQVETVVADIEHDGILGMDFLQGRNASINCNDMCVRINNEIISCTNQTGKDSNTSHRATAIIQPMNEVPDHLQDLYERTMENIGKTHQDQIIELLNTYEDVFSKGDHDIGRTDRVKHSIHTICPAPIRQRPRRPPMGQREEIEKQVNDMLERGIIIPSASPWSSPVVLANKKDGSKRFCIDYRLLNKFTVKDSFPLPRIDESIDSLDGSKYFCTLDLAAGYWQVPLDEDAKMKSAFVVPGGLYQFEVMPFGLCNAPSTFERLMEAVLSGLQWKILLIYLDDVIIFGSSVDEVVERMKIVLDRFRSAHLKLKPKKCHLFQKEVLYLGHVVSEQGVSTDPAKIEAVSCWPTPTNPTDVRSFLGLASYYRRFIKKFADIAKPLTALTQRDHPFIWTEECASAFATLKERLTTAPILSYPKILDFLLDTDTSKYGIGEPFFHKRKRKRK